MKTVLYILCSLHYTHPFDLGLQYEGNHKPASSFYTQSFLDVLCLLTLKSNHAIKHDIKWCYNVTYPCAYRSMYLWLHYFIVPRVCFSAFILQGTHKSYTLQEKAWDVHCEYRHIIHTTNYTCKYLGMSSVFMSYIYCFSFSLKVNLWINTYNGLTIKAYNMHGKSCFFIFLMYGSVTKP